jgi:hypothetical protein
MLIPVRGGPPIIIVFNGVEDLPLPFRINDGGHPGFFRSLVNETVYGHHPPYEEAMFLHGLKAVRRAGRQAWTSIPVHRRDVFPINPDEPGPQIES